MARIIPVFALSVAAVGWLGAVGCSSSNDPSTPDAVAGTASSAAGTGGTINPNNGGTGGASTGAAGTSSTAAGTSSSAGTESTTGGAPSSSGGAGGAPAAAGGTPSGTAGAGAGFTPLCASLPNTAGGMPIGKNIACTATDPQLCYKTCGPASTGYKSETCTNGLYAEQSGCDFPPDLDATCYKIPAAIDASCPATPPQASMPCTVAACTLCNVGGNYLDSTGASKAGYCVCPASATAGASKWSCASATAWPCPAGKGC